MPADLPTTSHPITANTQAFVPIVSNALEQEPQVAITKVLHVINGEHYSGAERVQDLLALGLKNFGFEVGFACVKPDQFADKRVAQEAPLFNTNMKSRFDFVAAKKLRKLIYDHQYKIVHAHTPRSLLLARMATFGTSIPLVYHVHSPTANDSTHQWKNRIAAWIEKRSLKGVCQLITVSQSLANRMKQQVNRKLPITTVANGVPAKATLIPRTTPTKRWVLGTVALFRPRKGIEILLDCVAELKQANHDVHLRAVGGFETNQYQNEIFEKVKQLGIEENITWTGFTSDVDAELAKMDLFILPSLFGEGLPMVVLEAMASGVPVVATDVEGIPEAIRDGVDGVLAQPADSVDLTQAIRKVIGGQLDWQQLRQTAWQRQSDSFSDVSMAQGVAHVYRRVLENE